MATHEGATMEGGTRMPRIRFLGEVEGDVEGQMPRIRFLRPAEDAETEGQEYSDAIAALKEAGPFIVEIDTDEDVTGQVYRVPPPRPEGEGTGTV